mmetsp:Transcript_14533/g.31316  ORF Transcript_14533/g.31316 Transcript_14533/m.31316 type:complete len:81 (+) Transcript_14533:135-377(+)
MQKEDLNTEKALNLVHLTLSLHLSHLHRRCIRSSLRINHKHVHRTVPYILSNHQLLRLRIIINNGSAVIRLGRSMGFSLP